MTPAVVGAGKQTCGRTKARRSGLENLKPAVRLGNAHTNWIECHAKREPQLWGLALMRVNLALRASTSDLVALFWCNTPLQPCERPLSP
jgi:hypothetical protein